MNGKLKLVCLILVLIVALPFVTQANSWSWEEVAEPYRGTTLNLVTVAWPEAIEDIVTEFTNKTGINVNVIRLAHGPLYENTLMDLRTRTGAYDVIVTSSAWLPALTGPGLFEPITEYLESDLTYPDYDLKDQMGISYGSINEEIYALPFGVSAQGLFYRKDLFEEYQDEYYSQYGDALKPPETWAEYNQIAEFFTTVDWHEDSLGYGTAEHGKREHSLMYMYQIRVSGLANEDSGLSVGLLDENEKPTFNNDIGRKALEQWVEALSYSPPGVLEAGNAETRELFEQGLTAMTVQFSSIFSNLKSSSVADKYAMAMVPGGKSSTGAWLLAINPHGRYQDASYLLTQWLTTKESDLAMFKNGGRYPSRMSTHAHTDYQASNLYWETEIKAKQTGVSQLAHPLFSQFEATLMEEIHMALTGQKTIDRTVFDLSQRWEQLIAENK